LILQDMASSSGGFLYLTGSLAGNWVTLRLNPSGDTDWIAYGSGDVPQAPRRVRIHPGGGVVVAGSVVTATRTDALVVRYSDDGTVLWRAGLATEAYERASDLAIDPSGNVLVVIENSSVSETRTVKFSPDGDVVWSRVFHDGGGANFGRAIAIGPDLSVAVVGTAEGDSAFTLKYEDPFPVEITSLIAERTADAVNLTWSVAPGLEPAGFEVLHALSRDDIYSSLTPAGLPAEVRCYVHRNAPPGEAYYILEVLELDGSRVRHGPVPATAVPLPAVLWVAPPSPNPAAEKVAWQLGLPAAGRVRLVVHDVAGRVVAAVVDAMMPAGVHELSWDRRLRHGGDAPDGVYFFNLEAGGEARAGKLVLGPLP
jgi:hypothetical protein